MGIFGNLFGGRPPIDPRMAQGQFDPTNGGIGGGLPGMPGYDPGLDTSVPVDPFAGQRPANPGFFGKGGMGGKLLMGGIGGALDGVANWGGAKPGYGPTMAQGREDQQELVKARMLQDMRDQSDAASDQRRREASFDTYGNGETGIFGRDGFGNVTSLLPGSGPKPSDWENKLKFYESLSPERRQHFQESGIGGGNTEYAFGQKRTLKQTVPGKAPGVGGGGSGKVTATRVVNGKVYRKINGEWYD